MAGISPRFRLAAGPPGQDALHTHVVSVPARFRPGFGIEFSIGLHIVPNAVEFQRIDIPVQRLRVLGVLANLDRVAREDDRPEEVLVLAEVGEHPLQSTELLVVAEVHR